MRKFIAVANVPTVEDVVNAYEGEGKVLAVTYEEPNYYYADMICEKNEEGRTVIQATPASEDALTQDGPVFIVSPDLKTAEYLANRLQEELDTDLSILVEGYLEDGTVYGEVASDVMAYVKAEATKVKKELEKDAAASSEVDEVSPEAEVLASSLGIDIGQSFNLEMGQVTVKNLILSNEGALAVLNVKGRSEDVKVRVDQFISLITKMEESKMKPSMKLGNVATATETTKTKGEVAMKTANTFVTKEDKEIAHVEALAATEAAQALLNLNTQKEEVQMNKTAAEVNTATRTLKAAGQTKVANQTKTTNEVKTMEKTIEKNETKAPAKNTTGKARTMGGSAVGRPGLKLGNAPQAARGVEEEGLYDSVEVYKGSISGNRSPRQAWYLEVLARGTGVISGEEITALKGNPELGIEFITLQSPKQVNDKRYGGRLQFEDNALAYVEITTMNGHEIIPFKILEETREFLPEAIKSSAIKATKMNTGAYTHEYQHYVDNTTEYRVKCKCGAVNTIIEVGVEQECYKKECKSIIGVLPAEAVGGTLANSSKKAVTLNNGFEMSEEVLAQVMVFAHYRLSQSKKFASVFAAKEQQ